MSDCEERDADDAEQKQVELGDLDADDVKGGVMQAPGMVKFAGESLGLKIEKNEFKKATLNLAGE